MIQLFIDAGALGVVSGDSKAVRGGLVERKMGTAFRRMAALGWVERRDASAALGASTGGCA